MSDDAIRRPPSAAGLTPRMMSARELREKLEELFDWLQEAEDTPSPDAHAVQAVRDAANMLLQERRLRHSDETAPRGG